MAATDAVAAHGVSGAERAPKTPASIDAQALLRERVTSLHDQAPLGAIIALVVSALFLYAFWHRAPQALLLSWAGALLLKQLITLVSLRRFRRVSQQADWDPRPWLHRYTLQVAMSGAILGCMAWLFFTPAYGEARYLTILTICGLAAGSITSYAYHPATMSVFLATLAVPTAIRLGTSPNNTTYVGVTIFLFYIGMVSWFGRNQARLLRQSIEIRHANAALVEQLRQRTLDLEATHQAKSRFFAAASHDLRQPLHALGYYSSLLQPGEHDLPHVQRIEQCIGALDDLLEGVLDIARLDSGSLQPHKTPVDLHAQLSRLAALYGGAATVKGLRLRLRAPKTGAWGHTDEQMLERVLANLVNNAIRYTPRGGVLLGVRSHGDDWHVSVTDTGIGIPAESHEEVFEEFVQLHNRERDASKGLGLGLATVKRLCHLLEHSLSLRSQPGRGSTFVVAVSKAAAPPSRPSIEHVAALASAMRGHVLVVEDNELVGESLRKVLQEWGLTCTVASDGREALECAQRLHFDAVLSDWRLPGEWDGCEVLRRLEEVQPQMRLRVLMTGERDDKVGVLPTNVPMLRKPVRPIRLRALLEAHLHSRSERDHTAAVQ